jgi:hypothetical protein
MVNVTSNAQTAFEVLVKITHKYLLIVKSYTIGR